MGLFQNTGNFTQNSTQSEMNKAMDLVHIKGYIIKGCMSLSINLSMDG